MTPERSHATATTVWAGINGVVCGAVGVVAIHYPLLGVPAFVLLVGVAIQVILANRGPR